MCDAIIDNLHSNPKYSDSGVPSIRSSDVEWGRLRLDNARLTSEDEYARRLSEANLVLTISCSSCEGGGTGKAALVEPGQRFSLAQRVMLIRPNRTKVIPKFLLLQLLSPCVYDDQIIPLSKGSASPHLNIRALRQFAIVLPDTQRQCEIVEVMESLMTRLDQLQQLKYTPGVEMETLIASVINSALFGAEWSE